MTATRGSYPSGVGYCNINSISVGLVKSKSNIGLIKPEFQKLI